METTTCMEGEEPAARGNAWVEMTVFLGRVAPWSGKPFGEQRHTEQYQRGTQWQAQ
jgi:hypothetical protein